LNSTEVDAANDIIDSIASEYDVGLKNTIASDWVNLFRTNDTKFGANCSVGTSGHVMTGMDGISYKIVGANSSWQLLNPDDDSVVMSGFNTFRNTCRYITSDYIAKKYYAELGTLRLRLKFPVKIKTTGARNGGRLQSMTGTMMSDFCNRLFAATDGLDTDNLCPLN
jgi:hypothetical protein